METSASSFSCSFTHLSNVSLQIVIARTVKVPQQHVVQNCKSIPRKVAEICMLFDSHPVLTSLEPTLSLFSLSAVSDTNSGAL